MTSSLLSSESGSEQLSCDNDNNDNDDDDDDDNGCSWS